MDGNRRFAKKHGLTTFTGHEAGYKKLEEVVDWAIEKGVKNVIAYAFSTENWKRTEEEVGGLLKIFTWALTERVGEIKKKGVSVHFIGNPSDFQEDIQKLIEKTKSTAPDEEKIKLTIALSYGGRDEIIRAIKNIPTKDVATLTEEKFSSFLDTASIPDPELVIRTGGEMRLSNFLLWQSSYSELMFSDTLWPDFSKEEFFLMLENYAKREKRNGK